jgi:hypothetical protein
MSSFTRSPDPAMMRQVELVERVKRYDPSADEALLNRAYVYAMVAHGNQKRASGDPFVAHPLEVAAILTDLRLDSATIVAAVLHDTIEDTGTTLDEISRTFGSEIASLVDGLTKLKKLDLVSKRAAQGENFRKLLLAIAADLRVLLVKLADRLHNMRTLGFMPPEKRRRIAEETLEIYAPLAGRMGIQEIRDELEELAFKTLNPDAHATISKRLGELTERNVGLVDEIESALKGKLAAKGVQARVSGRQKSLYSVWRKMERKSLAFEQLSDVYGFRISSTRSPIATGRSDRPHRLADGPWPLQGLHLDPEAERLPLHPHHGHRPAIAARRTPDPHARDGGGGGNRDRGPSPLQGGRDLRPATERREPRLPVASPHGGPPGRGRQPGGVPRTHEARALPRPGLLLHAEGAAHRAAPRRNCNRLRLRSSHRMSETRRSAPRSTAA